MICTVHTYVASYFIEFMYFSDIEECKNGLHNCDHICNELIGGFQCACNDGYELGSDNGTCAGKNFLSLST